MKFRYRPWGQTLRLRMGQQDIPHLQPHHLQGCREQNLTFVETPVYSPGTREVQSPLDEIKNIDYATEVFTFTALWDNAHNTSIIESEAQYNVFDQVREAQRHYVRLPVQLDTTMRTLGRWGRTHGTNAEPSI